MKELKKKDSFIVGPSQTRHAHHKFENSKKKNKQTNKKNHRRDGLL